MEDYKPNSHKYKKEQAEKAAGAPATTEKRAQKVVTGAVKTRKKSGLSKFSEVFISEDATNVKSYVLMDVLLPALKNAVWEVITGGLDMTLFGGSRGARKNSPASHVSYGSFYDNRGSNYRRYEEPRNRDTRSGCDYSEIYFETQREAEEVLRHMDNIMDEYKMVRVGDLYDLAGLSSPYTANDYGWNNIRNAAIVRTRYGFTIDLPRAMPIK